MKRFLVLVILIVMAFQITALAEEGPQIDPELVDIASEYLSEDITTLTSANFYEDNVPKDGIAINVYIGLCLDEDDLVQKACDYSVQTMQKIWDIPSVQSIWYSFTTEMTDQYGNKSIDQMISLEVSREGTAKVNYENFIEMVHGDYNYFLQICDTATIFRPIYDHLKHVKQW